MYWPNLSITFLIIAQYNHLHMNQFLLISLKEIVCISQFNSKLDLISNNKFLFPFIKTASRFFFISNQRSRLLSILNFTSLHIHFFQYYQHQHSLLSISVFTYLNMNIYFCQTACTSLKITIHFLQHQQSLLSIRLSI